MVFRRNSWYSQRILNALVTVLKRIASGVVRTYSWTRWCCKRDSELSGARNVMSGFEDFSTKDLKRICKIDKLVKKSSSPEKDDTTSASNFWGHVLRNTMRC